MKDIIQSVEVFLTYSDDKLEELREKNNQLKINKMDAKSDDKESKNHY